MLDFGISIRCLACQCRETTINGSDEDTLQAEAPFGGGRGSTITAASLDKDKEDLNGHWRGPRPESPRKLDHEARKLVTGMNIAGMWSPGHADLRAQMKCRVNSMRSAPEAKPYTPTSRFARLMRYSRTKELRSDASGES